MSVGMGLCGLEGSISFVKDDHQIIVKTIIGDTDLFIHFIIIIDIDIELRPSASQISGVDSNQ